MEEEQESLIESIRRRPGMYVGGTDKVGLHHLLFWALDDIGANARAGRGTEVKVRLFGDNLCEITDDAPTSSYGSCPTLSVIENLTSAFSDNPRGVIPEKQDRSYMVLLRALSADLKIRATTGGGRQMTVAYQGGKQGLHWVQESGAPEKFNVSFRPDPSIFGDAMFDVVMIRKRLQEVAATTGLSCKLQIGEYAVEDLSCPDGVSDLLRTKLVDGAGDHLYPYKEPFRLTVREPEYSLDLALLWPDPLCVRRPLDDESGRILSWANTVRTREGTHLLGLFDALRSANASQPPPVGVLSVFLPVPRLMTPVKDRLVNPEIRRFVSEHVGAALKRFSESNPEFGFDILRTK